MNGTDLIELVTKLSKFAGEPVIFSMEIVEHRLVHPADVRVRLQTVRMPFLTHDLTISGNTIRNATDDVIGFTLEDMATRLRIRRGMCPRCGGEADNGFSRDVPPVAYLCRACQLKLELSANAEKGG